MDVTPACDDGSCIIPRCTDSTASNYNSNATVDNGTCIPCVDGCTDASAVNYDPLATGDYGSFTDTIPGCTFNLCAPV